MKSRGWTFEYAAGNARQLPGLLRRTRHKLVKKFWDQFSFDSALHLAAISHVAPELFRASMRCEADLYIAHHPEALPAATRAARKFGAKAGYDAEDLHTGMWAGPQGPGLWDQLVGKIERHYLPLCSYLTSAAPGFSENYEEKYGVSRPTTILNVFPISERPLSFRPSNPTTPLRLYWFSQTIGEKRGLEEVVRALGFLQDCDVELHLRGNWAAGYRDKLLTLASSVGLDRRRIIDQPPAPPDEMVRLAAQYDIGLALEQPVDENRSLCLSNKLFVYLLAGNAIAATGSRGQKPLVSTLGHAAFSYEPGDPEGLAAGIRKWHEDRESLDSARERAWKWGTERYNWDLEQRSFLAVIDAVLRERETAASS